MGLVDGCRWGGRFGASVVQVLLATGCGEGAGSADARPPTDSFLEVDAETDAAPPASSAPTVSFRAPLPGQVVAGPVSVQLVTTDDHAVAGISLSVAGVQQVRLAAPPFRWTWETARLHPGPYVLTATVEDTTGGTTTASVDLQLARACDNDRCPLGEIRVEPGTFLMGSPRTEAGRVWEEHQHEVTLTRPFAIRATEVTQAEWLARTGLSPARFANCGDRCPAERLNWYEAVAFVNRLSDFHGLPRCYRTEGEQGLLGAGCGQALVDACPGDFLFEKVEFLGLDCGGYRLPTEAEWEYAARAGARGASPRGYVGDVDCGLAPNLADVGWYCGNSAAPYPGCFETVSVERSGCLGTHPVALKAANAWGLHDVLGNVAEWVQDWAGDYPVRPTVDPVGPLTGLNGSVRGGSWYAHSEWARFAARSRLSREYRHAEVGLRPVRTLR